MTININQFAQVPVRGQLDLQISARGVLSGVISVNQATSLKAGDPVMLDTAVTNAQVPNFIAAAASDLAIGYISYDVKKSTVVAGDYVEVAGLVGPVMWMVANETITAQEQLQQNANGNMELLAASKYRGIALDPGVASGLFRVFIMTNVGKAA